MSSGDVVTGLTDKVAGGRRLNLEYALSAAAGANTNVLNVPDDEPLPEVDPQGNYEDEDYQLYAAEGSFETKTNMPQPAQDAKVLTIGKKVYVIGGRTYGYEGGAPPSQYMRVYDTASDTWTQGSMPALYDYSYYHTFVVDSTIYLIGRRQSYGTPIIYTYNTLTNGPWNTRAIYPTAPASLLTYLSTSCTAVYDGGYVYFFGDETNQITRFHLATLQMESSPYGTLNAARIKPNAYVKEGKLYVTGGRAKGTYSSWDPFVGTYNLLYTTEVFDLQTKMSVTSNAYVRSNAATAYNNEMMMISGGYTYYADNSSSANGQLYPQYMTNELRIYTLQSNGMSLYRRLQMPVGMGGHVMAIVDGKCYIMGGVDSYGSYMTYTPTVYELDLGQSQTQGFPSGMSGFKTAEFDGGVYMLGGTRSGAAQKTVYAYSTAGKSWSARTAMPEYRRSFATAEAYGKLYVLGGQTSANGTAWTPSTNVWAYSANTWQSVSTAPRSHTHAAGSGGSIYAFMSGSAVVDRYDPLTDTWTTAAQLPQSVSITNVISWMGGIYVFGGGRVFSYDAGADTWKNEAQSLDVTNAAPLYDSVFVFPSGTQSGTGMTVRRWWPNENTATSYDVVLSGYTKVHSVASTGGKLYLFAGNDAQATAVVEYMPPISPWQNLAAPPAALSGLTGGVIDGKLYLTGGYTTTQGYSGPTHTLQRNTYVYDTVAGTWSTKAAMSTNRVYAASAVLDGMLYVLGGSSAMGGAPNLKTVEMYSPASNTWTARTALPYNLYGSAAAVIGGELYAVVMKSGNTLAAYVYNPTANTWSEKSSWTVTYPTGWAAGAEYGGKLYIIAQGRTFIYDPAKTEGAWSEGAATPNTSLIRAGVTSGGDGIYVVGGNVSNYPVDWVYQYAPSEDRWKVWTGLGGTVTDPFAIGYNSGVKRCYCQPEIPAFWPTKFPSFCLNQIPRR